MLFLILLCIALAAALILVLVRYRRLAATASGSQDELRKALNESHEQGVIDQTEAEMITNIFEFSEKEAQDIMTHRGDIIGLDSEMKLDDAVRFMLTARNSRFPVYEENIDHIIGIVHLKDAVRCREEKAENGMKTLQELGDAEAGSLLRTPLVIPETKNVDALFRQMQSSKAQMAVVIDEYGQTAGLLTMEDILEEIVGNIMDEYDEDETHIHATSNRNEFILDGRTPLTELEDRFGISFEDERAETLNGFLIGRMDRIPAEDEHFVIDYQGYRFRVLSVARQQVQRVSLKQL